MSSCRKELCFLDVPDDFRAQSPIKPFDTFVCDNDDSMNVETVDEELRIARINAYDTHSSTESGFSYDSRKIASTKKATHDRFIPQRQSNNAQQVNNFEAKEILFSKTQFEC